MPNYLLDACAVLAFLNDEEGAEAVNELFGRSKKMEITLTMNAANLIEVYYDCIRVAGAENADTTIREIYNHFPISIIQTFTPDIVREAAHLKARGKMSFADTILVATAHCTGARSKVKNSRELQNFFISRMCFLIATCSLFGSLTIWQVLHIRIHMTFEWDEAKKPGKKSNHDKCSIG